MFLSITKTVPIILHFGLLSLGLIAGLAPITLSGIGTRDAALVVLYSPFLPKEITATFGILITLRFIIYGLPGIPYIRLYLSQKEKIAPPLNKKT